MARFWLRFGDREVALPDGEIIVGRGIGCHVRLVAPAVSRQHLRLLVIGDKVMAYDLGSRNGSWVNGKRVEAPKELQNGDTVRVGTATFGIRQSSGLYVSEDEPETWDMRVETLPQPERPSPGSLRSTIELDKMTLLRAEADPSQEYAQDSADGVAVGLQTCAVCGREFELGHPFCPYCSSEPYSAPRYRTCTGCKFLLPESALSCPKCGLERPSSPSDYEVGIKQRKEDDRRREYRHPTEIHGLYVSSSLTFEADVTNLSRGGLFIVAELLDPVGTPADVVLSTDTLGRARFSGEVAHVVEDVNPMVRQVPGMGIRFVDITRKSKNWLEAFLRNRVS